MREQRLAQVKINQSINYLAYDHLVLQLAHSFTCRLSIPVKELSCLAGNFKSCGSAPPKWSCGTCSAVGIGQGTLSSVIMLLKHDIDACVSIAHW